MDRFLTGAKILLLLREGVVTDWTSLCAYLGIDPDGSNSTAGLHTAGILRRLAEANLIAFEGSIGLNTKSHVIPPGKINVTPEAALIQTALGLSLSQVASIRPGKSLVVEPLNDVSNYRNSESIDLFMAMPFSEELLPIYHDHIKVVASSMALTIRRADDLFTSNQVIEDIWLSLLNTRAVIAECTGRNPNVFYEIGIAHTIGKPVILITQDSDDVPFDLRHIRFIRYTNSLEGMVQFEEILRSTIRKTLADQAG